MKQLQVGVERTVPLTKEEQFAFFAYQNFNVFMTAKEDYLKHNTARVLDDVPFGHTHFLPSDNLIQVLIDVRVLLKQFGTDALLNGRLHIVHS